mgnify:FL=1
MNDRDVLVVTDHPDFERPSVAGRSDEHRDAGISCLERSPVVSECMQHVVIRDTVLAGARLDVNEPSLRRFDSIVNMR